MTRSATIVLTLLCLIAVMLAITVRAAKRTHTALDFTIAGRRLGPWLVAFGHAASAANAWIVAMLASTAFLLGVAALWMWAAFVLGCIINLWVIAPRLRAAAAGQGALTFLQVLTADAGERMQPIVVRSAVFMLLAAMLLQMTAALRFAAGLASSELGFDAGFFVVVSIGVMTVAVFAGGLRAANGSDVAQTILVMLIAVFLLVPALIASGGRAELQPALLAIDPTLMQMFAGKSGAAAVALAAGVFGFGLAVWGQPHAMVRLMAAKDEQALRLARWIAPMWLALLLGVVVLCAWCARVLYAGLEHPELALPTIASRLLPPWLATITILALASAVTAAIASQLLAVASSWAVDLKRTTAAASLAWLRAALIGAALLTCAASLYASQSVLEHGLFGFTVLGAAFGPLLLVRMSGKRVRPGSTLGAMWSGFILATLFHLLPDSPGDFLERVLPFVASLGIALTGGERRRNPDRADRSEETVHDRVPI